MSDSPVGWGNKTMDGIGTGLERGGDPPEQDEAARQAASLISCSCKDCETRVLPAVAAALRERDETLRKFNRELNQHLLTIADKMKRIAALEAARNEAEALVISHEGHIANLEAENERLRKELQDRLHYWRPRQ